MFVIKAAVLMLAFICFVSLLLSCISCYIVAKLEDKVKRLEDLVIDKIGITKEIK